MRIVACQLFLCMLGPCVALSCASEQTDQTDTASPTSDENNSTPRRDATETPPSPAPAAGSGDDAVAPRLPLPVTDMEAAAQGGTNNGASSSPGESPSTTATPAAPVTMDGSGAPFGAVDGGTAQAGQVGGDGPLPVPPDGGTQQALREAGVGGVPNQSGPGGGGSCTYPSVSNDERCNSSATRCDGELPECSAYFRSAEPCTEDTRELVCFELATRGIDCQQGFFPVTARCCGDDGWVEESSIDEFGGFPNAPCP